jgi:hypothetical protein
MNKLAEFYKSSLFLGSREVRQLRKLFRIEQALTATPYNPAAQNNRKKKKHGGY